MLEGKPLDEKSKARSSTPISSPPPFPNLSDKKLIIGGKLFPSPLATIRLDHRDGIPGLTLREFVYAAWETLEPATPLTWNWHLDVVCDHVEALLLDKGPDGKPCPQNLLLNVPPGTMKSLIFSVCAPAWMWLFRPSWRAIYASGTPSVVTRDSLKCRNLIKSEWYQETFKPAWKISLDQDEKQHFANTKGGFRKGVGAGGVVTGERADFLGTDDPNDAKEIHSKAHRDGINERWWATAFHNRIADPSRSKRAIIMQRLHEEDLAGYLLSTEKGHWAHLCMQMEFEEKGPGDRPTWLGWSDQRQEGDLLFPQMFPADYIAKEKTALGSAGYAGQMQQRPSAAEGNNFKREWWRFFSRDGIQHPRPAGCNDIPPIRVPKYFDEVVQSWDMAFKDTKTSDYVAGGVIAREGANKFLLAIKHGRMSFTQSVEAVAQMKLDYPDAWEILVEDKANGSAIVDTLHSKISGIVPIEPKGGKDSRAGAIQPQIEAGNFYLPEGAEWLGKFIDEFASFPMGKNDDLVDMVSQALIRMTDDADVANCRALLGLNAG